MNYPVDITKVGCRIPQVDLNPIEDFGYTADTGATPPPGSVIQGAYIPRRWYLRGGDITFVDCIIESWYGTSSAIHATKGGVRLQNCIVRGGPTACLDIGSNSEVIDCILEDCMADGIKMVSNNRIEGNWFRLLGGPNNPQAHADGIQIRAGEGNRVVGNMFDMPPDVIGPKGVYRNSACLMIHQDRGVTADNEWAYNYFRGGAYSVQISTTEGRTQHFHHNTFERGSSLFGPIRVTGEILRHDNRYHDGEAIDEVTDTQPTQPPEVVMPETTVPETTVPETPDASIPTWKVYNADGTVTERWK